MAAPIYPVTVKLTGRDGNAFAILGSVSRAIEKHLRAEGKTPAEVKAATEAFYKEATSGDYDNLLRTAMRYVDVT